MCLNELHTFPTETSTIPLMKTIFELHIFWINQSIIKVVCGSLIFPWFPVRSCRTNSSEWFLYAAVTGCVGDASADTGSKYKSVFSVFSSPSTTESCLLSSASLSCCWLLFLLLLLTHCPGSVLVSHQGWRASVSSHLLRLF